MPTTVVLGGAADWTQMFRDWVLPMMLDIAAGWPALFIDWVLPARSPSASTRPSTLPVYNRQQTDVYHNVGRGSLISERVLHMCDSLELLWSPT